MTAAEAAAHLGQGSERRSGEGWKTLCPCHDDHDPSLWLADSADGGLAYKCLATCDPRAVRAELARRGLIAAPSRTPRPDPQRWVYHDAEGRPVGLVERIDLPDGRKTYPQSRYEAGAYVRGLNGAKLPLYRLPETLAAIQAGRLIYIAEGEKCADALVGIGLDATTSPGGAGKWRPDHAEPLKGARVVILPDNDDPGRKHAEQVARSLAGIAAEVRLVALPDLPDKGDVVDWLRAGGTRAKLEALVEAAGTAKAPGTPQGITAAALLSKQFPEPKWAVPGLLAEGLGLLCGKPKGGKSWLALDLCLAAAYGGRALGRYAVGKGSALYLALEDTERRLQGRLRMMLDGQAAPEGLHLFCSWPRIDQGGVELLDRWLAEHPDCRLVVADTLQKLRPPEKGNGNVYAADYGVLSPLKAVADARGVALLIVHHLRKAGADDVFDTVSGTLGLTGAADTLMVLVRDRGKPSGTLHLTGRDIEEQQRALDLDVRRMTWVDVGDAEERAGSDERQAVLDVLKEAKEPLELADVAKKIGKRRDATRMILSRAADEGLVVRVGKGRYAIGQASYHTHSRSLCSDGANGSQRSERSLRSERSQGPEPERTQANAPQRSRSTRADTGETAQRTQRTQGTQPEQTDPFEVLL